MKRNLDSKKAFVDAVEGQPDPPEKKEDEAWCSDDCKKTISAAIFIKYPCKQKFSQVDVIPLYASGAQRFYRVTLWVDNLLAESASRTKEVWKTFRVTLEGAERTIVLIEEDKKKKLAMTEKGLEFMKELETPSTDEG